jgi:hypothetical protein
MSVWASSRGTSVERPAPLRPREAGGSFKASEPVGLSPVPGIRGVEPPMLASWVRTRF